MNKHSRTIPYVVALLIIGVLIIGTTTTGPSIVALTTLGSLIVFIGTSILWLFFSRPLPWLHYGSLALFGGSILTFLLLEETADVVSLVWQLCKRVVTESEKVLTITTHVFTLYAGIGILTALVRHLLHLPTKKLLMICLPLFLLALTASITLQRQVNTKIAECRSSFYELVPGQQ